MVAVELSVLIRTFKTAEPNLNDGDFRQLGVLISDDPDAGLDPEAIRVLSAWMMGEHRWTPPRSPCPDEGRATKAAYDWMVRGMNIDYVAIADAAGVTRSVARAKLGKLLGARMLYADGTVAKAAKVALEAGIAKRVKAKQRPAPQQPRPATPKPGTN